MALCSDSVDVVELFFKMGKVGRGCQKFKNHFANHTGGDISILILRLAM